MKLASPVVARQYSRYMYPQPVTDLKEYVKHMYDRSDPSFFRRKLWPRRVEPENLDILIAGCGTNQAATYAYKNPSCRVTGIDISMPSLSHQQFLKEKHDLDNLELYHLSIGDVALLEQDFDLVVSTGVLHHLPDPDAGLRALRNVLRPHGVMSIMVYGYWGRVGVYMMQDVFRMAGLEQADEAVQTVKDTLASLPKAHPARDYVNRANDLDHDTGWVDTFLHRQDRAYTVPQVLEFAAKNGLKFRDWLDRRGFLTRIIVPEAHPLRPVLDALPPEEQWAMLELLTGNKGTHRFLLCHQEVPRADYIPDWTNNTFLDYVPHLRQPIKVEQIVRDGKAAKLKRGRFLFEIQPNDAPLMEGINSSSTIGEIVDAWNPLADSSGNVLSREQKIEHARTFFSGLFEEDHLMLEWE